MPAQVSSEWGSLHLERAFRLPLERRFQLGQRPLALQENAVKKSLLQL